MRSIGLYVSVAFGSGGMFQYSQQLLAGLLTLPRDRYAVKVFYVDEAWTGIVPQDVESVRLNFPRYLDNILKVMFRLYVPNPIIKWLFSLTALQKISDSKLDLVIFPSQDLAGIFVSPVAVNVVHDLMHRYEPQFKESSGMGRSKFRDRLFAAFWKNSNLVLVDSEVGKHQFLESYHATSSKVGVLPYIAPDHIVNYNDEPNRVYFENLKLPGKFIFYPAQFWPHKNHKILVEAAGILRDEIKDLKIIFIGPKNHAFEEISSRVHQNALDDVIRFIDYVPNGVLGGFYLRARAMVMPTYYGPTNIPPLEAIALGCPVAVSRIYGMPAQLGDASLYFNNKDANEVASVIKQLWTDDNLQESLRHNSKAHFAQWNRREFNKRLCEIIERHVG